MDQLRSWLVPDGHPPSGPSYVRALRPNYPLSVVAGGVYSATELKDAIARDVVVRQHYSNFRWERLRIVPADHTILRFVSYRKQNQVFWTGRRLRIPAGELLLSDGSHWARARCGNQLSENAAQPVEKSSDAQTESLLGGPDVSPEAIARGQVPLAETPMPDAGDLHALPIGDGNEFRPLAAVGPGVDGSGVHGPGVDGPGSGPGAGSPGWSPAGFFPAGPLSAILPAGKAAPLSESAASAPASAIASKISPLGPATVAGVTGVSAPDASAQSVVAVAPVPEPSAHLPLAIALAILAAGCVRRGRSKRFEIWPISRKEELP